MLFQFHAISTLSPRERVASASEPGEGIKSLMLSLSKYETYNTSILRQAQDEVLCMNYFPSPQPLSHEERGLQRGSYP